MIQGQNPYHILGSSKVDAEAALREAELWLLPADEARLKQALVALHATTHKQKSDDRAVTFQLKLFHEGLQGFPGDVVLDVINRWSGKYFPALNELKAEITKDARMRERTNRIRALKDYLENRPAKPVNRITPEQADAIARKHGY